MFGRDVWSRVPAGEFLRRAWPALATVLAVVGLAVGARLMWGAPDAAAQAPAPRPVPSARGAAASAPRPVPAPTGQAAPASATAPAAGGQAMSAGGALKIMAVVNGETITREQLAAECLRRHGAEVLDSVIHKQLIVLECQRRGVTISEREVHEEIGRIAAQFSLTPDRWLKLLADERNIAPAQYQRDIIWPSLALRKLAADQLALPAEKLQQGLESELGPRVQCRLIVLDTREQAEAIRREAVGHPDRFNTLAKDHSTDPHSAAAQGLIPPIRRHVGEPEVEQAAFALREGQVSDVLELHGQFLILKCERHIPPLQVTDAQRQQVQAHVEERVRDEQLREVSSGLFARLQAEAQVRHIYADPTLAQQQPGVAAVINGAPLSLAQLGEECLLRHGKDVLEGEIHRRLLEQALRISGAQVQQPDVDAEIARAAEAYGFQQPDGTPDVPAWLRTIEQEEGVPLEFYLRDVVWPSVALKKLVQDGVAVSEEDLQKGFQANFGERVDVQAIVLTNHRLAQQVWDMARRNPTEEFFGELAAQYSAEPVSQANHGEVPPVQRFGGRPLIEEEAFKLQPGEQSGIIAVEDKFVILRCRGRTQPIVTDFAAVKDELHRDLLEKKLRLAMAQEFERLREAAQIDNFLAGVTQSGRTAPAEEAAPQARIPFRRGAAPVAAPPR